MGKPRSQQCRRYDVKAVTRGLCEDGSRSFIVVLFVGALCLAVDFFRQMMIKMMMFPRRQLVVLFAIGNLKDSLRLSVLFTRRPQF